MAAYKPHPFNVYLRKHYAYKTVEEEEIRTQIYSNKETNDFVSMVSILKSVWFKTKATVKILVKEGTIYLKVIVMYFESVPPEEVTQLRKDLEKQITKNNILVNVKAIPEEDYNYIRVKEL